MGKALVAVLCAAGVCSGGTVVESDSCLEVVSGTTSASLSCEYVIPGIDGYEARVLTQMAPGTFDFTTSGLSGYIGVSSSGFGYDQELATIMGGTGSGLLEVDWTATVSVDTPYGGLNSLYVGTGTVAGDQPLVASLYDGQNGPYTEQLSGSILIPFIFGTPFVYSIAFYDNFGTEEAGGSASAQVSYSLGAITSLNGDPSVYSIAETDPIPEPGSMVLTALGGVVLIAWRRALSGSRSVTA